MDDVPPLGLDTCYARSGKMEEFNLKGEFIPKGMEVFCALQTLEEDSVVVILARTKTRLVSQATCLFDHASLVCHASLVTTPVQHGIYLYSHTQGCNV